MKRIKPNEIRPRRFEVKMPSTLKPRIVYWTYDRLVPEEVDVSQLMKEWLCKYEAN